MKMRDVDPKEMRDIALEWHRKRNNLKERE